MRSALFFAWLVAGLPGAALAAAAPLPLVNQRVELGGEPITVTVDNEGAVTVTPQTGGPLRLKIPGASPNPSLRTAVVAVKAEASGSGAYLFIKVQAADGGQRLAVIGKLNGQLATAYAGPIGPVGRDGEYAVAVELTTQGLLRYQRVPGLARCDGEDRLFLERYQGSAGFRPAPELTVPELAAGVPAVTATTHDPGGTGGAPLGIYRFVAASAQLGVSRADLLAPPQELEDGKAATAWRVPGDARGAFVTARADGAGHSMQLLRITPAPTSQGVLPKQLALILDGKQRVVVNLAPPSRDGSPQWVVLPAPIVSSCLSLVIIQAPGPVAGQATAIGKVAVFSELDADASAAGLRRLAERAASADFGAGEAALRTLRALIEREKNPGKKTAGRATALLQALTAVLPSAQGPGRRRLQDALLMLAAGPGKGEPLSAELAQTLVAAVAKADVADRPPLWTALEQLGGDGETALLQLAGDSQKDLPARAEALKRLGAIASPGAVQALLALTSRSVPVERPLQRAVVGGLGDALRCRPGKESDAGLVAACKALSLDALPAQLLGSSLLVEALALAQADCPPAARALLSQTLIDLWQRLDGSPAAKDPGGFTLRYRIVQGLAHLGAPSPESLAFLQRVIAQDQDPVLRQTAVRAALAGPPTDAAVAKAANQALLDADPGVRLAALTALSERPLASVLPAIEQALKNDRWPLCRRAAVESRAAQCPPQSAAPGSRSQALRQAVSDPDEPVQRLALAGLSRCEGAGALDVYTARLQDTTVGPVVRSQACALLVRHGFSAAGPAQQQAHEAVATALLDLLADPAADERSASTVISCARAVGELGDARDLPALLRTSAAAAEVPPPIRQTALASVAKICSRRPALSPAQRKALTSTLQTAAHDSEPRIKDAAQHALARCGF